MDFFEREFFNNTILDYLFTLCIIVFGVIIIFLIKTYVFSKLKKKAEQTKNKFDDLVMGTLGKTLVPAAYFGAIYLSLQHLELNESFAKAATIIGVAILTFMGIRFIVAVINFVLVHHWLERFEDEKKTRSVKSIMPIVKIVIYSVGVFFLLDNLGFKISTLVAGLGIGGVAVALAGQAILGDLFSYFAILFDRPFEIGDFIIVGEYLGAVEHIGIKTTRIKSLSGEQLVFANTDLTNSRVRNYKRMEQRRVSFKIGVTYDTPPEKLKEIPPVIKKIVEGIEDTTFDRAHFCSYGDFSLIFEIVYYVFGADYNKYMDIQQRMNLEIYEEFSKRGVEFAYPTQTLFLKKTDS